MAKLSPITLAAKALAADLHKRKICLAWKDLTMKEKTRLMKIAKVVLKAVNYEDKHGQK